MRSLDFKNNNLKLSFVSILFALLLSLSSNMNAQNNSGQSSTDEFNYAMITGNLGDSEANNFSGFFNMESVEVFFDNTIESLVTGFNNLSEILEPFKFSSQPEFLSMGSSVSENKTDQHIVKNNRMSKRSHPVGFSESHIK